MNKPKLNLSDLNHLGIDSLTSLAREQMLSLREEFVQRFNRQGLTLGLNDLALWVESKSPKVANKTLSYALELVKPFVAGLGFEITELNDQVATLKIHLRPRNQTSNGSIHTAAVLAAAEEAATLLLERHAPVGGFQFSLETLQMDIKRKFQGELDLTLTWDAIEREKSLIDLQKNKITQLRMIAEVRDESKKKAIEVQLHYELKFKPRLVG